MGARVGGPFFYFLTTLVEIFFRSGIRIEKNSRLRSVRNPVRSGMKTVSATTARTELYRLIDVTLEEHEPVQITGKRGNAVLVAEEDWRSIQETLHLLGIPGMRESIREGMAESIEDCTKEIDL